MLNGAKILAFAALSFLLIVLGVGALRVERLIPKLDTALDNVNTVTAQLNGTTQRVNLTIKEAQYLILQAGLTADAAKKASDKELVMLDAWNGEITRTVRDADAAMLTANASVADVSRQSVATLAQVSATVRQIDPSLQQAQTTLQAAQVALDSSNTLIGDPNLRLTLSNTQHATAQLDAIADDTRAAVHSYLHPTWPKRVWGFVTTVGVDAGRILF